MPASLSCRCGYVFSDVSDVTLLERAKDHLCAAHGLTLTNDEVRQHYLPLLREQTSGAERG